ncbi:MAG: hypothetical protein AAF938_21165 [Myxococcota bacterium]
MSLEKQVCELPGGQLVATGLQDLRAGHATPEAHLVSVAATRLRLAGVSVPQALSSDPQLQLYLALGATDVADPYVQYNAWLRELTSFLEALERRVAG